MTPAGYGLAIAPLQDGCIRERINNNAHAKFDAMQVSSSRKSSGASCDIRDYEGARTKRSEELGEKSGSKGEGSSKRLK